jgi:hypothetical protein
MEAPKVSCRVIVDFYLSTIRVHIANGICDPCILITIFEDYIGRGLGLGLAGPSLALPLGGLAFLGNFRFWLGVLGSKGIHGIIGQPGSGNKYYGEADDRWFGIVRVGLGPSEHVQVVRCGEGERKKNSYEVTTRLS